MTFEVQKVVDLLEDAGVRLDRGLTEADVRRIEQKFGFAFGADQRALLRAALPLGDAWLNWRHATPAKIRERLQAPIEGVIHDVRSNDFWADSWGPRPGTGEAAEQRARTALAAVPVLVPLYGDRYMAAAPAPAGSPVLSVDRTDVVVRGDDLLDYVVREFGDGAEPGPPTATGPRVAFWSDL